MKNFIAFLVVVSISFVSLSGDWPYDRLNRLYGSNSTRCLKVSKRYIHFLPEKAAPYYFASVVYRDKSKKHQEIKAKYRMMSQAIGFAMSFEAFEDIDLMTQVNWARYMEELDNDTDDLIALLDQSDLSSLGNYLGKKYDKMIEGRNTIILNGDLAINNDVNLNQGDVSDVSHEESDGELNEVASIEEESENAMFNGLASGKEVVPSFNKIQEQELLDIINAERKEMFMPSLKLDHGLVRAARYHANDMAIQDYFLQDSYDRIDGELVHVANASTRIRQFHKGGASVSQNIAGGNKTANDVFLQWSENGEHFDAMFDESSRKVGIGLCYDESSAHGYYWVLVTARK